MAKRLYIYAIIALLILVTIQSISLMISTYDKAMYENVFTQASKLQRRTGSNGKPSWIDDNSRPGTHIKKKSAIPESFKAFSGEGRTLV